MNEDVVTTAPEEPKAVLVAKDVLAHLHAYRVKRGDYVHGFLQRDVLSGDDLRDNLAHVESECTVCALGACLLSKARLYDAVPMDLLVWPPLRSWSNNNDVYCGPTRSNVVQLLEDIFSNRQLDLIEAAFERSASFATLINYDIVPCAEAYDAEAFGKTYDKSDERLAAIMTNVIDNNGVFKPPQYPESRQRAEKEWENAQSRI